MLHGDHPRSEEARKKLGKMQIDNFVKVLDEVVNFDPKPTLSPSYFSEPLLNKGLFVRFVKEARKRKLPVSINTNALLIDDWMARFLVDNLSIVSVSIDAMTPETLLKARSTNELDKINNVVLLLLKLRGENIRPRIVVSFTEETFNAHEKKKFLDYWIDKVDVVRINKAYDSKKQIIHFGDEPKRLPCREIYDNMNVDFDGTIRYCCLDPYRDTNLGNVFEDGVGNVWTGKKYSDLRKSHEDENCKIDSFCKNCDQWAGFNIVKENVDGDLLVRSTIHSSYYNRLDRMNTWDNNAKRIDIIE